MPVSQGRQVPTIPIRLRTGNFHFTDEVSHESSTQPFRTLTSGKQWRTYHSAGAVSRPYSRGRSSSATEISTTSYSADSDGEHIYTHQQVQVRTSADTPSTVTSHYVTTTVNSSNPTDPQNSFFTLKNADPSLRYALCDTLELHIEARDRHSRVKRYGGDYFWVSISSPFLEASQPADEFIDHQNGTYTARFILRWAGTVRMRVLLIKSSEYIALLRELRETAPARFAYNGRFRVGLHIEVMPCHITKEMYLGSMELERSRGFCDFSDRQLGYPWFCLKPLELPCSSWVDHMGFIPRGREQNELFLQGKPRSVMHNFSDITQTGPETIEVVSFGSTDEEVNLCTDKPLPLCTLGLPPRPEKSVAGFFYQAVWKSLVCQSRNFNTVEALKCLRDHSLFFYGDSTLRQWFEYLTIHLGRSMKERLSTASRTAGPRSSHDKAHNISLFYRHHGYPIRNVWTRVRDIKYAANEIDELSATSGTVILLTFCAHFTPTNVQFYRDRWKAVKGALQRLRTRVPGVLVIVKSANTREQQSLDMSNWYAMELDKIMREELSGEPGVAVIDVWDMTLCHSSGYRIHPLYSIISQEIKMLLSFMCPSP